MFKQIISTFFPLRATLSTQSCTGNSATHYVSAAASSASPSASSIEAFIPNENGDLMQYCKCTNDFVNAIIDDYFNSFKIRKDLTEGLVYEWTNSMEQIHDRYSDEEIITPTEPT